MDPGSMSAGAADHAQHRQAQAPERPPYLLERADRREESRRRVEKVALSMFSRRGFDAVTVDEICVGARISPATFYRYFGSKEGVIFLYEEGFLAVAREIGGSVDPSVPPIDQIRDILERCSVFFQGQSEIRVLRDEIVLSDVALLQRTFAIERTFEDVLARALASARRESEPSAGTLVDAAVCMVVLRLALIRWRYQNDVELSCITNDVHESLRARFS